MKLLAFALHQAHFRPACPFILGAKSNVERAEFVLPGQLTRAFGQQNSDLVRRIGVQ